MNDMKYIEKKSVVPIPPVSGAVSDTINVEDKVTNAPSINLVQQMTGIPQDGIITYDGQEIPEGYEEVNLLEEVEINWTNSNYANNFIQAYKNDKEVNIVGQISLNANITTNTWVTLGTIEEKPNKELRVPAVSNPKGNANSYISNIKIDTNGNILAYCNTAVATFSFMIRYVSSID